MHIVLKQQMTKGQRTIHSTASFHISHPVPILTVKVGGEAEHTRVKATVKGIKSSGRKREIS